MLIFLMNWNYLLTSVKIYSVYITSVAVKHYAYQPKRYVFSSLSLLWPISSKPPSNCIFYSLKYLFTQYDAFTCLFSVLTFSLLKKVILGNQLIYCLWHIVIWGVNSWFLMVPTPKVYFVDNYKNCAYIVFVWKVNVIFSTFL